MASADSVTNESSIDVQWMWNANDNPYIKSKSMEWNSYSDVENLIIEEAFRAGQTHAILDDYSIDLKHKFQIFTKDKKKQRSVQRMIRNKDDSYIREQRFTFTPINPKRPFGGLYGWISPFIRATAKYLNITRKQLPSKDPSVIPMVVESAVVGIIEEGKKIGKQREAEHIAKILRKKKYTKIQEVWECCAYLYSLESFLYNRMNEIMRLIGEEEHELDWRNNARTLGPFCLLLWDNPYNNKTTERGTILYRGANLSDELVLTFQQDCLEKNKPVRSFQSFTSCSRNRAKAEQYGNVLFIMTIKHAFSVNLQPFSEYPGEEEELVSPGVCFTIDSIESDQKNQKYVIYLNLIQQYRRKLTYFITPSFPLSIIHLIFNLFQCKTLG